MQRAVPKWLDWREGCLGTRTYVIQAAPVKVVGTRELVVHEHYRLVYEISNDTVHILTLIHTARLWPPART